MDQVLLGLGTAGQGQVRLQTGRKRSLRTPEAGIVFRLDLLNSLRVLSVLCGSAV